MRAKAHRKNARIICTKVCFVKSISENVKCDQSKFLTPCASTRALLFLVMQTSRSLDATQAAVLAISLIILSILGGVAIVGAVMNSKRKKGENRGSFGLGSGKDDDDEALVDMNGHGDDDDALITAEAGNRTQALSFEFNGAYDQVIAPLTHPLAKKENVQASTSSRSTCMEYLSSL